VTSGGAPDKYGGVVGTFKKIVNEEGIAKLWRGNGTNVIRVLPYSATQFTAYDT
jgi:solute carrier family 25 phosphate transporter 23/24/25/41